MTHQPVMTGVNNGVVTMFKREQPCLQAIHCMVHRLELAYKEALGHEAVYKKLSELLHNEYVFYHKSPLNRSNLKISAESLDLKLIVPPRSNKHSNVQ